MARTGLETKAQRARLPIAPKPVWISLGDGVGLGYRRTQGAGTWSWRKAQPGGTYRTAKIALADDIAEPDGRVVLSYYHAVERAKRLSVGQSDAEGHVTLSIGDALDSYRDHLAAKGGDKANVTRVRKHLGDMLAKRPVSAAKKSEFLAFREALQGYMTTASCNRTMAGFKAALNLFADRSDADVDRRAWEIGLAPFDGVRRSNHVALPDHVVAAIVAAARVQSPEFGNLCQLLAETGARFSQLCRCRIADLDADRAILSIPVSNKGRGRKEIQANELPVSTGLAARLRIASGDRPVTAPLLLREDGAPWRHTDEQDRFSNAVAAAGQDAKAITCYALRHSWIIGRLKANVPARIVAQLADTSIVMLERTYSLSIGTGVDAMMRAALPNVEPATADVVQLHR